MVDGRQGQGLSYLIFIDRRGGLQAEGRTRHPNGA